MVGVGGDSAGGNISLSISRRQLAAGRTMPAYQLLYYTSTDFSTEDESFRLFRDGYGLDEYFRQFMISHVFPGDSLKAASRELSKDSFSGMPATIVVTAGFDMLRDAGRKLARRFEQDRVAVTYLNYPTLAHGFLQWSAVVEDAERAAVDTARLFGAAIRSRAGLVRTVAKQP